MRKKILSPENLKYYLENWQNKTSREWLIYFQISRTVLDRINKEFGINPTKRKKILSSESKQRISEKRKEWLKNNPDKHPWKNKDKFKSQPCEKVKAFLDKLGIQYITEFAPEIENRFFSIDIAIPDKMIALEINGNQHYERDGRLKPYYQERHDLIVNAGWNVFEIHYSACFNLDKWSQFVDIIRSSEIVKEFDYFNYKPIPKKQSKQSKNKCDCGNTKQIISKKCFTCNNTSEKPLARKAIRPSKEELLELIWSQTTVSLGKFYGISDVAIKKWAKIYEIPSPPRGYWIKYSAGKFEECEKIKNDLFEKFGIGDRTRTCICNSIYG